MSHINLYAGILNLCFVHMDSLISQTHFLSIKSNATFLRNTLPTLMIFYVFQKFYNLRKYVRVHADTLMTFRSFSYVGTFIKCHVHVRLSEEPFLLRVSDMHM
jgi:hypothetical protein